VGGNSPILNSYPHPELSQVHSARQVLFYSKPDVLLLDNSASEVFLSNEGKEGLVSTIDCTIWYVNYDENATVRLVSSHFAPINSIDVITEYKNDSSYIKPNNYATCSDDKTIRVWSLDN
jgi:WD40 repeat protein